MRLPKSVAAEVERLANKAAGKACAAEINRSRDKAAESPKEREYTLPQLMDRWGLDSLEDARKVASRIPAYGDLYGSLIRSLYFTGWGLKSAEPTYKQAAVEQFEARLVRNAVVKREVAKLAKKKED